MIKENGKTQRVITFLDRQEIDFLDKLGKDALFFNGTKIPRTKIIEVLIDILSKADIDVKGIKTEEEFKERILGAMKEVVDSNSSP
ncbi:MAG: hypothetical protein ISS44_04730 [Candidatus Omnitrophica bacterium]|nr:hypothetical protein [Candidatus Omnitrophota bacterium]